MTTATLHYYADPMCSWCWGFAPVIDALRQQRPDLALQVHAGGLRNGNTRPMTATIRAELLHHWDQVTATTGQPIRRDGALPDGFVYDTEPANRALLAAARLDPAGSLDFLHALQEAFYAQGQDITRDETLAAIAVAQGLDAAEFSALHVSQALRQATQEAVEARWEAGVSGFPTLLVDTGQRRRVICMGYQPLEVVQATLDQRLAAAS